VNCRFVELVIVLPTGNYVSLTGLFREPIIGSLQSKMAKGGGALCAGNAVALLVFGPVMP